MDGESGEQKDGLRQNVHL